MDSQLLIEGGLSEEDKQRGEVKEYLASPHPYKDVFDKYFPFYLAMGMTYEQFWEQDCTLVKYWREAEEIKRKQKNEYLWLQGMYVYDAVSRLYPLFNSNVKKGTKIKPYVEEPYPISERDQEELRKRKEHRTMQKGLAYMNGYIAKAKGGATEDANRD